jgi:hypothetical protein
LRGPQKALTTKDTKYHEGIQRIGFSLRDCGSRLKQEGKN